MKETITMSSLPKTWILDIDGTIVKHNGYKIDGCDSFLDGAKEYLQNIPKEDMIIFVTSRTKEYKEITEKFFSDNGIRYDAIIYEAPYGERILVNDEKTSGLKMSFGIDTKRDEFGLPEILVDESL